MMPPRTTQPIQGHRSSSGARSGTRGTWGMLDAPEDHWELVNTDGTLPATPTAEMLELARLYDEQSDRLDLSHAALAARAMDAG